MDEKRMMGWLSIGQKNKKTRVITGNDMDLSSFSRFLGGPVRHAGTRIMEKLMRIYDS